VNSEADRPSRGVLAALAVLTLINLFNYLDRYVVSALAESLKGPPLGLRDAELGGLMTGFVIVYMLTSPLFGSMGDRSARPRLIAIGVAIWSLATVLGGLAQSYPALFAARAMVGVGEAAYGTIAPALLADYFPKRMRGRVFAVFFSAIPIGSAAGYVLGGFVDQHYGWRAAFFVAGAPGLLLSFLAARLVDPPRGGQDQGEDGEEPEGATPGLHPPVRGIVAAYRDLFRNAPYRLTVLGYAAYTFALGALAFWMPSFLERVRGVPKGEATVVFGSIVVVTGFVGTFVGGWLGDFGLRWTKQSYLWVSGVATLLAVPAAIVAFTAASRPVYLTGVVAAELLLFVSTGPVNSAIVSVVAPEERATAVALSILTIHLLGDVPSPPLIGAISDRTSLGSAFRILPLAIGIAGSIWIWAAWKGGRAIRRVPAAAG